MPAVLTRRESCKALVGAAVAPAALCHASPNRYAFSVLTLLRPSELILRGAGISHLHCSAASQNSILESGRELRVNLQSPPVLASGPGGGPAAFSLEVPGQLRRRYFGTLRIEQGAGTLLAFVQMDLETAVSSIAGAELPVARAGLAALLAQSVVARSFLSGTSNPRHGRADFCDTTHCQFLRSPAPAGSVVARAALQTAGLVLGIRSCRFPALYSAACGGFTEGGERDGFPYLSVACDVCRAARSGRRGHGFGLCQEGAMGLGRRGWDWQAILAHYYPVATLERT